VGKRTRNGYHLYLNIGQKIDMDFESQSLYGPCKLLTKPRIKNFQRISYVVYNGKYICGLPYCRQKAVMSIRIVRKCQDHHAKAA